MQNIHTPVLISEILKFLPDQKELKIFDGTFGGGGYSMEFLELGHKVWACDLDALAVDNFSIQNPNLTLKQSSYLDYITTFEDDFFDFIVLDLGFSTNQLKYGDRGFSYQNPEEILDLRYDIRTGNPAWKKISKLIKPQELAKVLWRNSGESLSPRIANKIFEHKFELKEITTGRFVEIVKTGIPGKFRSSTRQILSRVWQALRIWVNDELLNVESFVHKAPAKLAANGQIAIVSFHSLEDKLITKQFRELSRPRDIDEYGNKIQQFQLLTKKAILPTPEEIENNLSSRSAMLRVLKRV